MLNLLHQVCIQTLNKNKWINKNLRDNTNLYVRDGRVEGTGPVDQTHITIDQLPLVELDKCLFHSPRQFLQSHTSAHNQDNWFLSWSQLLCLTLSRPQKFCRDNFPLPSQLHQPNSWIPFPASFYFKSIKYVLEILPWKTKVSLYGSSSSFFSWLWVLCWTTRAKFHFLFKLEDRKGSYFIHQVICCARTYIHILTCIYTHTHTHTQGISSLMLSVL